jgi:hypothetical protein
MPRPLSVVMSLFLAVSMAGACAAPAGAETATNLKCKGCVGKKDLGKKAVRQKHIKNNAVTGKKIKNGTIGPADLAAAAKPTGADSAFGDQAVAIPTDTTVRSVTITAPTAGLVLAVASGTYSIAASTGATCSITLGQTLDTTHGVAGTTSTIASVSFAANRLLEVPAGDATINLVCARTFGSGGAAVVNSVLTAAFIPNRY